jgi:SAM-dependent methyltransferase
MTSAPKIFNRQLLLGRLRRAAKTYGTANFLKRRTVEDTVHTLKAINRRFEIALEIGSRIRQFEQEIKTQAYDKIDFLINTDLSDQYGNALVLDEEALPIKDDTLDLVVSHLTFHMVNDLPGALIQIRRALRPDGLLIASQFGGETLKELRSVLMEAELEVRAGAGPRIAPFAESFDCVDLLKRAGFNMPVVDTDKVRVTYSHPLKLMQDLRAMGETNILFDRPKKGLNRTILARAFDLYFERFASNDGGIVATFEIITLSGWKPHESQQKPLKPGSAKIRLAEALGVKEGKL